MSYCVFFDLDETLISCKTMIRSLKYFFDKRCDSGVEMDLGCVINNINRYKYRSNRMALNRYYYAHYSGFSHKSMAEACSEWYQEEGKGLLNKKIVKELEKHKANGAKLAVVSGSFYECVLPIARDLGIDKIICNVLEVDEGLYSGRLYKGPIIGKNKEKSVLDWINEEDLDLKSSYCYGDDMSDIPMLSLAQNPIVVGNNQRLQAEARSLGWQCIS